MVLQVVARYVFQVSISGLDELAGHTAVWLYLVGSAHGTFDRSQIKADMLHLFVASPRILAAIRAFTSGVSVVVCCFMTAWSLDYVRWSIIKQEATPTLQIPTVIFQAPFLIGAVLMVIYFAVEMVEHLRECAGGRGGPGDGERNG